MLGVQYPMPPEAKIFTFLTSFSAIFLTFKKIRPIFPTFQEVGTVYCIIFQNDGKPASVKRSKTEDRQIIRKTDMSVKWRTGGYSIMHAYTWIRLYWIDVLTYTVDTSNFSFFFVCWAVLESVDIRTLLDLLQFMKVIKS